MANANDLPVQDVQALPTPASAPNGVQKGIPAKAAPPKKAMVAIHIDPKALPPSPPATPPSTPAAAPARVPASETAPADTPATPSPPNDSADAAPPVAASSAIQLMSVPDAGEAQQSMVDLATKYANILSDIKLRLVRADLGNRGVYYRIQSQPLSAAQAARLCSAFKKANAACIIVHQ